LQGWYLWFYLTHVMCTGALLAVAKAALCAWALLSACRGASGSPLCANSAVFTLFKRSSVLRCLETSNELFSICIVFKCLIRAIEFQSSYSRSFTWFLVFQFYMRLINLVLKILLCPWDVSYLILKFFLSIWIPS